MTMNIKNINDELEDLRNKAKAAREELDMAVVFHEICKPVHHYTSAPAANSYASGTLNAVLVALRREMLAALFRLWDRDKRTPGMESIADTLGDSAVIEALVQNRMAPNLPQEADIGIRKALQKDADKFIYLVNKYKQGGSQAHVLKRLRALRNKKLAHRQVLPSPGTGASVTDQEIEEFYKDNKELVRILVHLANAEAYDPNQTESVYRHAARQFWARVD